MNGWEIEDAARRFGPATPNLAAGAATLYRLRDWTDSNSDGWAYWPKPVRAAARLIGLLEDARLASLRGGWPTDITDAELTAALRPIKAFLTRQGVAYGELGL